MKDVSNKITVEEWEELRNVITDCHFGLESFGFPLDDFALGGGQCKLTENQRDPQIELCSEAIKTTRLLKRVCRLNRLGYRKHLAHGGEDLFWHLLRDAIEGGDENDVQYPINFTYANVCVHNDQLVPQLQREDNRE